MYEHEHEAMLIWVCKVAGRDQAAKRHVHEYVYIYIYNI